MTLCDSHKITISVTEFWVCIKRADRSHSCPADTNNWSVAVTRTGSTFGLKMWILVCGYWTRKEFFKFEHFIGRKSTVETMWAHFHVWKSAIVPCTNLNISHKFNECLILLVLGEDQAIITVSELQIKTKTYKFHQFPTALILLYFKKISRLSL